MDPQTRELFEDFADDRNPPPVRPCLLAPAAAVVGFAVEAAVLLHARTHNRSLFHDAPMFLIAALPFLALAVIGLMAWRHPAVQVALLPALFILTVVGVGVALDIRPPRRGDFGGGITLILAYLAQWGAVAFGLFTGFGVLAVRRR
jgi:hypothetical protein